MANLLQASKFKICIKCVAFLAASGIHTFLSSVAAFRCQESCGLPRVGGANVDEAIRCVFAALLWHSHRLRDELVLYGMFLSSEVKLLFGSSYDLVTI